MTLLHECAFLSMPFVMRGMTCLRIAGSSNSVFDFEVNFGSGSMGPCTSLWEQGIDLGVWSTPFWCHIWVALESLFQKKSGSRSKHARVESHSGHVWTVDAVHVARVAAGSRLESIWNRSWNKLASLPICH